MLHKIRIWLQSHAKLLIVTMLAVALFVAPALAIAVITNNDVADARASHPELFENEELAQLFYNVTFIRNYLQRVGVPELVSVALVIVIGACCYIVVERRRGEPQE